jgi:hypothetical protein
MANYPNLVAGAKGLLGDCINILSEINPAYVIVGGWSPLLLSSGVIRHPGTHDVDLLFSDGLVLKILPLYSCRKVKEPSPYLSADLV